MNIIVNIFLYIEYESDIQLGSSFTNDFLPQQAEIAQLYGIPGAAGNSNTPSDALFEIFEDNDSRKDVTVARGWTDADGVYHEINSAQGAKTYTKNISQLFLVLMTVLVIGK